jgi:hypothetical protein
MSLQRNHLPLRITTSVLVSLGTGGTVASTFTFREVKEPSLAMEILLVICILSLLAGIILNLDLILMDGN